MAAFKFNQKRKFDEMGFTSVVFKDALPLGRDSFPNSLSKELVKYVSKRHALLYVTSYESRLFNLGPNDIIIHHGSTTVYNANISERVPPSYSRPVGIDDVIQFDIKKPELSIKLDSIDICDKTGAIPAFNRKDMSFLLKAKWCYGNVVYRMVNIHEARVMEPLAAKAMKRDIDFIPIMADDTIFDKEKLKWAADNEWNVEWGQPDYMHDEQIRLIASDGFSTFNLNEAMYHKVHVPVHEQPESEKPESEDEHVTSDDYDTTVAEEGGQGQPLSMEYSMTIDDNATQLDEDATLVDEPSGASELAATQANA